MGLAGLAAPIAVAGYVAASSAPPPRSQLAPDQLRPDQLRPGDCLAEVVFAGQAWPRSAAYPGDDAIGHQADDRCDAALAGYTGGNPDYVRDFVVESIEPSRATWAGGDRSLACVAYESTAGQPGGTPVSYSIRAALTSPFR